MFKKKFSLRSKRGVERDERAATPEPGSELIASQASAPSSVPTSTISVSTPEDLTDQKCVNPSAVALGPQDPIGLRVLHRPSGQRQVDIIFVHGLGGNSRATWCHTGDPTLFWPLTFLPLEAGLEGARTMTFGYNAHFRPGEGKKTASVLDFAKELLFDMRYGRDDAAPGGEALGLGTVPIIFVAHSMGGLVVKEAYMLGQSDPAYQVIVKSISGIIFLSTPHRGTHLAEILNRILQVSFIASPTQFISDLATGSHALQKLNEQFRHVAPKLDVASLYETRPTVIMNTVKMSRIMVLEKESSVLGYPGEISRPLDADHHEVCKYRSRDDPHYITVRNTLLALIEGAKTKDTRDSQTSEPPLPGLTANTGFEKYLSVPGTPEADYNFFRDRWTFGTCTWILGDTDFTTWATDMGSKPRVLWIHGNAGNGKSVLSSFIIDHLTQLKSCCSYFFVRFTDETKRTVSGILRSLASQVARSVPSFGEKVRHLEAAGVDLASAAARDVWQWLYKQALFQLDIQQRLFLVIDGFDEAEAPESLIRLLLDLHTTQIPLRILIVSRRTREISAGAQRLEKRVHLDAIQIGDNRDDIKAYIDEEMDIADGDAYRDEVTSQLLQRAQGNFLWVHLAVQKINTCYTKAAVDNALSELPLEMNGFYDRMAAAVRAHSDASDRRLGMNILGWATCSRRALTLEELGDALDDGELLDIRRIGYLCGGFVVVDMGGSVSLIHETAREYLTRRGPGAAPPFIELEATNDTLFLTCIRCLGSQDLRARISRNEAPAFLDYAMRMWHVHLSLGRLTNYTLEATEGFLRSPAVLTLIFAASTNNNLRVLVDASRHLDALVLKLQNPEQRESRCAANIDLFEGWATDLTKLVGMFGRNLVQKADAIWTIPPLCPTSSTIYQQFGHKLARELRVSGAVDTQWGDSVAEFPTHGKARGDKSLLSAGSRIAIITGPFGESSVITLYDAATFEEVWNHSFEDVVIDMRANSLGDRIAIYGHKTTRVWDVATGNCVKVLNNPTKGSGPYTVGFTTDSQKIIAGSEGQSILSSGLGDDTSSEWELYTRIGPGNSDGSDALGPVCSALGPDCTTIAYGYRSLITTAWELEPQKLIGTYHVCPDNNDTTAKIGTEDEIDTMIWHPFNRHIFALTTRGRLLKWDPYENPPSMKERLVVGSLAVSRDGALVATYDVFKIYILESENLRPLYHLSVHTLVKSLSFAADSQRLYSIQDTSCKVWDLGMSKISIRKVERQEGSGAQPNMNKYISFAREAANTLPYDNANALASQPGGSRLYIFQGWGPPVFCEVGKGPIGTLRNVKATSLMRAMTWSGDGRYLAVVDDTETLQVMQVSKRRKGEDAWEVNHIIDLHVPGPTTSLLFHSEGHLLLLATDCIFEHEGSLSLIDMGDRKCVLSSKLEWAAGAELRWICHPTLPKYLLGLSSTHIHVLSWQDLRHVATYRYRPPPDIGRSVLRNLLSSPQSPLILLEIHDTHFETFFYFVDPVAKSVVLLDVTGIPLGHETDSSGQADLQETSYRTLPPVVDSAMHDPLAILSHQRLIFMDHEGWICTWPSPSTPPSPSGGESVGVVTPCNDGIERHYCLPQGWVPISWVSVMRADGALLLERNGEIVAIECASLKEWIGGRSPSSG